ncbi:Hypothetical protein APM_1591 [Acidiphilium sp. PM]|nr:Hypothetical protein APM_1591 [Acidiphilium sp. PM]
MIDWSEPVATGSAWQPSSHGSTAQSAANPAAGRKRPDGLPAGNAGSTQPAMPQVPPGSQHKPARGGNPIHILWARRKIFHESAMSANLRERSRSFSWLNIIGQTWTRPSRPILMEGTACQAERT